MLKKNALSTLRAGLLTLGTVGLALGVPGAALAAPAHNAVVSNAKPEQVIIHGFIERKTPVKLPNDQYIHNPERITLSEPVSYSDLNLGNHKDVMTLKHRIAMAAQDVCQELHRRYPDNGPQHDRIYVGYSNCAFKARRNAMKQVDTLVADASS